MTMSYSDQKKVEWVQTQVVGRNAEFNSPFGSRRIIYADTTASGQSLFYIENYIIQNVLPFYGNTHTCDSHVGSKTSKMLKQATQYMKKCLGAGPNDALLCCGSGSTAAIKRLQEVLRIAVSSEEERWVVFVGPHEHHSNLLSWRRSLAEVVEIGLSDDGLVDLNELRNGLERFKDVNRPMLGSFSACSNVTGICTDTRAIARLLHQYGAFACFDFAASGPHVEINMRSGEMDGYDAIFLSPHKYLGGPGSPGILVMNKSLYQLTTSSPSTCGGGTVSYVNPFSEEDTLYYEDVEERENAGTPPITQTIRAALSFWVKEFVGQKTIQAREQSFIERAIERLGKNERIVILGNTKVERLPILSFLVFPKNKETRSPTDDHQIINKDTVPVVKQNHDNNKPLNGSFVAKLLNDLFGIQARGGCACAGSYGHFLLNIDRTYSLAIRSAIQKGYEGVKPGWTRISFPFYMSDEEFEFILKAVEFVSNHGQSFLHLYNFYWKKGSWSFKPKKQLNTRFQTSLNLLIK